METEGVLRDWRFGPIQAERLAADILGVEGFSDVDPQATLGGGDDRKDILARRDGLLWVAAVYFPPTHQNFTAIKRKFVGDLQGVARHNAEAFAFFVNQYLTLGERRDLARLAEVRTELYHVERLRHILDVPKGYGLRLEYLRIAMKQEEQVAFLDQQRREFRRQLVELKALPPDPDLDAMRRTLASIERTVSEVLPTTADSMVSVPPMILSARIANSVAALSDLNVGDLRMLHRELTDDMPWANGGQLRLMNVSIGSGSRGEVLHALPSPEEVPRLIEGVAARWRDEYPQIVNADRSTVIQALARLHAGITAVHPFLDGNGRLARALLDLAAHELVGCHVGRALTEDLRAYYTSLRAADAGGYEALERLIAAALIGD